MTDFARIRSEHPIFDVLGALGIEVQRGNMVRCPSPEHEDSTPSCHVSPGGGRDGRDLWHCHGCQRSGDVIGLVAEARGLGMGDAARLLDAGELGPARPSGSPHGAAAAPHVTRPSMPDVPKERVLAALSAAWEYFSYAGNGKPVHTRDGEVAASLFARGRDYLANRGVDIDRLVRRYGRIVGHTPGSSTGLVDRLSSLGFSADELLAAGLARSLPHGLVDAFQDRAMFAVRDVQGRIVGFAGRRDRPPDRRGMVEGDAEEWWESPENRRRPKGPEALPPRWRDSGTVPGLPSKSETLYWPVGPSGPGDRVVIVEGPVDALAVAVAAEDAGRLTGPPRIVPVAIRGKSVSQEQWRQIAATQPSRVALGLDADADPDELVSAAQAHGLRAMGLGWEGGKDAADVLEVWGAQAVLASLGAGPPPPKAPEAGPWDPPPVLPSAPPGPELSLAR